MWHPNFQGIWLLQPKILLTKEGLEQICQRKYSVGIYSGKMAFLVRQIIGYLENFYVQNIPLEPRSTI